MAATRNASSRRLVIVGVASAIALACMVGIAVSMVRSGHGFETYRTFWLVEEDWSGFLVFIAATVLAVAVGLAYRWREGRRWRELERKYGTPEGDHAERR